MSTQTTRTPHRQHTAPPPLRRRRRGRGAIVLAGLPGAFASKIEADPRISAEVSKQVSVAVESGLDFVSSSEIGAAAQRAGLDTATTQALVDDYEAAQLGSLKAGLLLAALLALASLAFTRGLPHEAPSSDKTSADETVDA